MLEQLSYGQVNPQNMMGQLGNPQVGGVGSFGMYPQTAGISGFGGINPVGQFGTPVIDPLTAAYIQQQLAQQALVAAGINPNVGQIYGQQASPFGVSPLTQILGQQHPYGQTSGWGQTPYGSLWGQISPYSQIFGQSSPWGLGQVSPYAQISPYSQNPLLGQHNPVLSQLQAALAAQYLIPQLTQQQLGRVPFATSPFGQSGVTGWPAVGRGISPFTHGVSPFTQSPFTQSPFTQSPFAQTGSPFTQSVSPLTQGLSPFGPNVGVGSSPFQSFGYGGTQ